MSLDAHVAPYVGLQPYLEEHEAYFFGRERETRTIISNLYAAPLTVLYGGSGVGKSSVVMASVVPQLRRKARTAVVVFRAWQGHALLPAIKAEVARAVERVLGRAAELDVSLPLDKVLLRASKAVCGTITIIFDQFEEYFLYHPLSEAANTFDSEFAMAINQHEGDAGVLLVVREEALAKLDRFRARIPNLLGNTLRLEALDVSAAERAIRKPLDVLNERHPSDTGPVCIEDGLVTAVLQQVRSGQLKLPMAAGSGGLLGAEGPTRIEAPFLQLVMMKLWREELGQGSRQLRRATLEQLGGSRAIVRSHLLEVMDALPPEQQAVCARFFDRLVTPSGTKVLCREDDLQTWAEAEPSLVRAVLQTLAERRILRAVSSPTFPREEHGYEIFHDVLAPSILEWRRQFLERRERLKLLEEKRAEWHSRNWQLGALILAGVTLILSVLGAYALDQTMLARERYRRIQRGIEFKHAVSSGDSAALQQALDSEYQEKHIQFEVTTRPVDPDVSGKPQYEFTIAPVPSSVPGGLDSIGVISYRLDNPRDSGDDHVFKFASRDTGFAVSYQEWGCLTQLAVALIEYKQPDKGPSIATIDMCEVLGRGN
jgi:hypothetical protein